MNVNEAIRGRRAVRSYLPKPVEEGTVRALLEAATHAPSALNGQPWLFAVVQDPARLKRYSDQAKAKLLAESAGDSKAAFYRELLENPGYNIFYDATTLVVIGAAEQTPYSDADCWLAAQNLMLAACDVGLGSCCIGFAVPILNTPEVKSELGFPKGAVAVAPIILGYPTVLPPAVPRAEPKVVSWSR